MTLLTNAPAAFSLPWLLAIALPLLLAFAVLIRRVRCAALWLAPWTAVPALVLALWAHPDTVIEAPWLLLGVRLGMDKTAQVFLLFTALLWILAGVYARAYLKEDAYSHRFFSFFLAAMSGNLGLILAQDMISFYLFFALMSFAAYGLVVHEGSREARQAGTVYIALVMIGEVMVVSVLLLTAAAAGSLNIKDMAAAVAAAPARNIIIGLTLAGFGIKVGALPLHVWLPLAHPVAPTPASAVLSGAMIKAGLIGWLRFLPLGEAAFPGWGSLCLTAGLVAAFYGVVVGLTQDNPKTLLAYSSISQMGLMTVAIGLGLMAPGAWPLSLTAILVLALHHALVKGALFLGVGVAKSTAGNRRQQALILAGLFFLSLSLSGAPLTSGAVAKLMLKPVTIIAPAPWSAWLGWLLPIAAVGTTLLMGRFLFLMRPYSRGKTLHLMPGIWLPWVALLLGVAVITWFFAPYGVREAVARTVYWGMLWPVTAGTLGVLLAWRLANSSILKTLPKIPAGDLLMLAVWLVKRLPTQRWRDDIAVAASQLPAHLVTQWRSYQVGLRYRATLTRMEGELGRWSNSGMLFLLLAAMIFALLAIL